MSTRTCRDDAHLLRRLAARTRPIAIRSALRRSAFLAAGEPNPRPRSRDLILALVAEGNRDEARTNRRATVALIALPNEAVLRHPPRERLPPGQPDFGVRHSSTAV